MNELMNSEQLKRLAGQELTSVMVMTNCVRLQFIKNPISVDGNALDATIIDIETGFELRQGARSVVARQWPDVRTFRKAALELIMLIEQPLAEARQNQDGTLTVRFQDAAELLLLVSDEGFESYHVRQKGSPDYTAVFHS